MVVDVVLCAHFYAIAFLQFFLFFKNTVLTKNADCLLTV